MHSSTTKPVVIGKGKHAWRFTFYSRLSHPRVPLRHTTTLLHLTALQPHQDVFGSGVRCVPENKHAAGQHETPAKMDKSRCLSSSRCWRHGAFYDLHGHVFYINIVDEGCLIVPALAKSPAYGHGVCRVDRAVIVNNVGVEDMALEIAKDSMPPKRDGRPHHEQTPRFVLLHGGTIAASRVLPSGTHRLLHPGTFW